MKKLFTVKTILSLIFTLFVCVSISLAQSRVEGGDDFAEIEGGDDFAEIEGGDDFAEIEGGDDFAEIEGGDDFAEIEGGDDYAEIENFPESLKNANGPSLAVYPNPNFQSILKVFYNKVGADAAVSISNMVGEVFANVQVGNPTTSSGSVEFNVANLSNGIYFVSLRSGIYSTVQRIVIQR